jgi:hypothetical protein
LSLIHPSAWKGNTAKFVIAFQKYNPSYEALPRGLLFFYRGQRSKPTVLERAYIVT